LILLGTLATTLLPAGSLLRDVLTVLGAPLVALLLDTLLCAWLLGSRRGWSRTQVSDVIGSALPGVAMVILIAGAGGVFGKVLVDTGIGAVVSEALRNTGLPVLALGFLLTLLLRAVQGSTTVALVTTAGILSPLIASLDLSANHMALLCLAMGGGGLAMSHINDAGYWMFTKLAGLNVGDGLRTWTVLVTVLGTLGFVITLLLWPFV
jgi:GntP family gluconate:H+ symporter